MAALCDAARHEHVAHNVCKVTLNYHDDYIVELWQAKYMLTLDYVLPLNNLGRYINSSGLEKFSAQ